MCDYIRYSEIMQEVCNKINTQTTGTPKELGKQLQVSERTVRRIIEQLIDRGLSIKYSRKKESYICENASEIMYEFRFGKIDY